MIERLRHREALRWVNSIRRQQGQPSRFIWPRNEPLGPLGSRTLTCPVARALGDDWSVGIATAFRYERGLVVEERPLPRHVSRAIGDFDERIS